MSGSEAGRYSRQVRFQPIGEEGQRKIRQARVALVGCGALGSFQAEALARAGIGYLRLIDRDVVEWSNLQRQWLYTEADARDGSPKAAAAAKRIAEINSDVAAEPVVADLTPDAAPDLLEGVDLILDATDNFETRYLVNDFAVSQGIPWIYGAAVGSYGLEMPVLPGVSACFRCVYPNPPQGEQPTCETAGVLGSITSMIAAVQVADALRLIVEGTLRPRLTTIDVWGGAIRQIAAPDRDPDCPCCARSEFPFLEGERRAPISLCGRNAVQIHGEKRGMNLGALAERLRPFGEVRVNDFALRAMIAPYELTVFPDGRAIIKGTTDTGVARSLYARYVGA
jgi:adenylyltransferase/sulfurtransferase